MAGVNGNVKWGIVPLEFSGSDLAGTFFSVRGNYKIFVFFCFI